MKKLREIKLGDNLKQIYIATYSSNERKQKSQVNRSESNKATERFCEK